MTYARGCFTASPWMNFLEHNAYRLPQALELTLPADETQMQAGTESKELRAGDLCPNCSTGRLDYDGLLNLSCPQCGHALAGCFT